MIQLLTLGSVDLRGDDGAPQDSFLSGSKRLALLAYLALARPRGFQRRDTVVAFLWPESDQKHARGALRNLLHHVRRSLGEDLIVGRGDEEIGIAEGKLWCDVHEFESALEAGRLRRALELYRGDLLEGLFVLGAAPSFEHWLDEERARLRRLAAEAAWALAHEEESVGNATGAPYWARRAVSLSPLSEAAVRRLMEVLERTGDRAGALATYEDFARRWVEELEVEPSQETQALADRLRSARVDGDPNRAGGPGEESGPDAESGRELEPRTSLGIAFSEVAGHSEQELQPSGSSFASPPESSTNPPARPPRRRLRILAPVLALALAAVLGVAWALATRSEQTVPSVAVLPFHNLGAPEDAYLSHGITAEVTARIAKVGGLRVMSSRATAPYEDTEQSDQEIARELDVSTLLRGDVRREGDRLHITAHLVDASSGERLWAEEYDRAASDLFRVPGDVAERVASVLDEMPSGEEQERTQSRPTVDPFAYDLFLRGRELSGQSLGENEAAIQFFRQAILRDPRFADAHAGLASAYARRVQHYGLAREWADSGVAVARRATELAPEREAGYNALGFSLWSRGRLTDAGAAYRRALEINPNDGTALDNLGVISIVQGRYDEAVHWLGEAQRRDPRSGYRAMELGGAYWELGEDERAEQWYARARELGFQGPFLAALQAFDAVRRGEQDRADTLLARHPDARYATHAAGVLAGFAGRWNRARTSFEGLYHQAPEARLILWGPTVRTSYALALERTGDGGRAASLLDESLHSAQQEWERGIEDPAVPMEIAMIHAWRGEKADAYDWLERAYAAGERRYRTLRLEPAFESFRNDARFQRLLGRMRADVQRMRGHVRGDQP